MGVRCAAPPQLDRRVGDVRRRKATPRDISYTRFREEVLAGNVAQVTSIGERIEGRLRPNGRTERGGLRDHAPGVRGRRPACAARAQRRGCQGRPRAGAAGVEDRADRIRARPCDRRAARPAHAPGDPDRPVPLARQALPAHRRAHHLRRRGRHRGGPRRARGDRGLPARPGALPAPGCRHPARRAAVRSARYRQDAARARGGGRGRRALLLAVRVRVRRDGRGGRRPQGPRPVRAGASSRRRRSSSSTSSMRSAGCAAARSAARRTTSASRP